MMLFSAFWRRVDSSVAADVSDKHTFSIFRTEMAVLGNGVIYIGLEEGKAKCVGQSGRRSEDVPRNVAICQRIYANIGSY
jgi:hypothetical protein